MLLHSFVTRQLAKRRCGADADSFPRGLNAFQLGDVAQADDTAWRGKVLFERGHQVSATGENLRFTPLVAEQRGGFLQCAWCGVFKRFHAATPPFCNTARTRSGVKGKWGARTPIAFATALAMAAPGDMTGGSPR